MFFLIVLKQAFFLLEAAYAQIHRAFIPVLLSDFDLLLVVHSSTDSHFESSYINFLSQHLIRLVLPFSEFALSLKFLHFPDIKCLLNLFGIQESLFKKFKFATMRLIFNERLEAPDVCQIESRHLYFYSLDFVIVHLNFRKGLFNTLVKVLLLLIRVWSLLRLVIWMLILLELLVRWDMSSAV